MSFIAASLIGKNIIKTVAKETVKRNANKKDVKTKQEPEPTKETFFLPVIIVIISVIFFVYVIKK